MRAQEDITGSTIGGGQHRYRFGPADGFGDQAPSLVTVTSLRQ